MPISEEGRKARFKRWEEVGLDRIENDLVHTKGTMIVGGGLDVQALAWEWVRMKKADQAKRDAEAKAATEEVLTLKPNFHGVGVDLKALTRRMKGRKE
jgi:hypothetical protein